MVKVTLSEKDIQLLNLLSQVGVVRPKQSKIVYGDVSRYHLRRIEKLVAAEILIRDHGYIRPTATGLTKAGIMISPLRMERYRYKEHSLAVELMSQLPDWIPTYARELKQKSQVQRGSRIGVTIKKDTRQYAVYIIADNPKQITLRQICTEMSELSMAGIKHVLIFCTHTTTLNTFAQALSKPPESLTECCLLPYPAGIEYFKRQSSLEFQMFINDHIPGVKASTLSFVDYQVRRIYISVLLSNDLVKICSLVKYATSAKEREKFQCAAIRSPGQELNIPGVQVIYDEPPIHHAVA
jgi:DNA-binding Lrp family transcriptional regulator